MKSKKIFLDPTSGDHDVISYEVDIESYPDADYIDFDVMFSDGSNKFSIWQFISNQGHYDDVLNKLDVISAFIEEARAELVKAHTAVYG